MRALILILVLTTPSCACFALASQFSKCASYKDDRYEFLRFTAYTVPSTSKTPRGIPVGPGVDGPRVDALTAEVETCLGVKVRDCGIHAVMLAPDWFVAPGTETQVFPCDVPPSQLCTGINQWPATLVVTPDLHAYKWELVRMLVKGTPTTCY